MEVIILLSVLLSTLLIGAMSPGPSFIVVSKAAISQSRKSGIATAIGLGLGGALFTCAVLLGLHTILTHIPLVYYLLKIAGGIYLLYLAIKIYCSAHQTIEETPDGTAEHSFFKQCCVGFFTQISNPKTALFYSSVFAAVLPSNMPSALYYLLPPLTFIVEAGWYSIVALGLSTHSPRVWYIRCKSKLDKLASMMLAGLGIKLLIDQ